MRAALWLIGLFGMAVAAALFAGSNQGTVTLFWAPYRLDLSLNLAIAIIVLAFVLLYAALRALAALLQMPHQARRWRSQQKERAMHHSLLEALSHQQAGRFLRARKSALAALAMEESLAETHAAVPHGMRLRAAAHMVAADASHALQDRQQRDHHWREVLANAPAQGNAQEQEMREGAQMRAARWALDDRDASDALRRLAELPQGAARRTIALRIRLKASRLANQTSTALNTARLLAKHRAFSPEAARSLVRSLSAELIGQAHDPGQLQAVWDTLDPAERRTPELALRAAQRLLALGGDHAVARQWLHPVWDEMLALPESFSSAQRVRLARVLEAGMLATGEASDQEWLARIETAAQANPRDPTLQYLAGMACLHRGLWGRAQMLLAQAARSLQDDGLRRHAWRALAQLAEQRGDEPAAAQAWKRAADAGAG